jgi:hypothetical protein
MRLDFQYLKYSQAELIDCVLQDQVKPVTIAVFKEDGLAGIAAKDDVVDRTRIMDTGF